jgi:nicotinate-nucleotide--dimethylbenzimidazole phosphoribosyltransferase
VAYRTVVLWPRPVPTVGDRTTAAERAANPQAWAFAPGEIDALHRILAARRDVRRYRPDPVDPVLLRRVLGAAHAGPSVGHSQPWRFVVVEDGLTRQRAATLADEQRLAQAAVMDEAGGRHLLDLDLEGIREAPLGIVVCCDRRTAAAGVLGRATFADADMWSCACAIENLWLAARAEGLGVGWVTLFRPDDLAGLVAAPPGVTTLGWLCLGWPDERPPAPGLERRGWSTRLPLDSVILHECWPETGPPAPPASRLAATEAAADLAPVAASAVVAARDAGDRLLTPPSSLGLLDAVIGRLVALGLGAVRGGTLVIAAADHPVAGFGVSAYHPEVTRHVVEAALAGRALGAVAALQAGLEVVVVDAGVDGEAMGEYPLRPAGRRGDLVTGDAMTADDCRRLVAGGRTLGARLAGHGLVALGEVGVGNTTVAAALAALSLDLPPERVVGLGAGSDRTMADTKIAVVRAVTERVGGRRAPLDLLAAAGGPEIAVLAGIVLGAAEAGGAVVLDGLATSVAALLATRHAPAVAGHLVAGQRSREPAHGPVLAALGLEPLLDLRIRAGEGAGAAFATGLILASLQVRAGVARVASAGATMGGPDRGGEATP